MTVSSEAKRTLVKSPPELWSEVSDAESLARHLDGVHEITITRVEPETAVEWEAHGVSGSVRLQPSGFGTKVVLCLSRELHEPRAVEPAPEPVAPEPVAPEPVAPEPAATEPAATEPIVVEPPSDEQTSEPIAAEPEPVAAEPEPERVAAEPEPLAQAEPEAEMPRQGFFVRLFKRRRKAAMPLVEAVEAEPAAVEPEPAAVEAEPAAVEPEPAAVEPEPAAPEPEPVAEVEPEPVEAEPEERLEPVEPPAASVTADLAALEAEMAQQDEAMLTAMLDRLGAAHHRPFSRS